MSNTNKRSILLVLWLALLGGLFFAITHLSSRSADQPEREATPHIAAATLEKRWPDIVANAAAPARGNPQAHYTLIEFGDFQCPQCGKARPILEGLLKQAPDQVNLLFVHRPFADLHPWALPAAEASEVAAAQGKFWPMYDTLYSHQVDLESGYYGDYAAEAGLDRKSFQADFDAHKYRDKVTQAAKLSDDLGIQLTPVLLIRDNRTGVITPYVGMDSKAPGAPEGFLGIKQLAADPPWRSAPKTARK